MISNSLLHVAIEMVNKLRINCGMMLGAWMSGVIRLIKEQFITCSNLDDT